MKTITVQNTRKMATESGSWGERVARREYGLQAVDSEYADLSNKAGSIYEVKTTATSIGQNPTQKGRFRLIKSQHDRLVRRDRLDTSWYIFVLVDDSTRPPTAYLKRQQPADVGQLVGANGGWFRSSHEGIKQEKKLPYEAIFPNV